MALITPDMPVAPLENLFNALDDQVNATLSSTSRTVASEAARLALYPTPVQGNRVYRSDLGYEEAYFGLYNSTSNPGGRTVAGWAPATSTQANGVRRTAYAEASGASSNGAGAYTTITFPAGRFSVAPWVTAITNGGTPAMMNVGAISKDSMQIAGFVGSAAVQCNFYWHAVQMTATDATG